MITRRITISMLTLVPLSALMLSGCNIGGGMNNDWELSHYQCSTEQLEQVKAELAVCEATDYKSSYCFLTAKKSICDKIVR